MNKILSVHYSFSGTDLAGRTDNIGSASEFFFSDISHLEQSGVVVNSNLWFSNHFRLKLKIKGKSLVSLSCIECLNRAIDD